MTFIQFFYKFYDIEVGNLPRINQKSVKKSQPIYFKDLPDKEIIRETFKIASPMMKAIMLFSSSSGCAKAETLSLTVGDYIDAVSEYLPKRMKNIYEIIDYLKYTETINDRQFLKRMHWERTYLNLNMCRLD